MKVRESEVVVIGGGTTGCIVAARLAERGRSVLLLEAGGRYRPSLLGPPLPSQRIRPFFSWRYRTTPQPGLGGRRLALPLGRVLGGSSSVNAMMYCPGSPADYRRWADAGNRDWSVEAVASCYGRAESREGSAGAFRISRPRYRSAFSEAVVAAGAELGHDLGFFDVSQHDGRRTTTAEAYLPAGLATGRLDIVTGATVSRILLEGTRAVGVEFRHRRRTRRAMAAEIVVSAGAVNSPHVLQLSGIGDAAQLHSVGIPVLVDLPGVGANLMDHVRVPVLFQGAVPGPGDARHWLPALLEYVAHRRGLFTSNCCEAGGPLRSHPELDEPDLQLVTHFKHPHGPGVADLEVCLFRAESRGRVQPRSASPHDPPAIHPEYLSAESDVRRLLRGIGVIRELAGTRALQGLPIGPEVRPGPHIQREDDLIRYCRQTVETCYHLAGTCRMGSDEAAVVDERLRVRGVDGLRVADTSIMPDLIRGNTQAPAILIGETAADLMAPVAGETAPVVPSARPAAHRRAERRRWRGLSGSAR